MQAMPAFFRDQRGVLVSHRSSFERAIYWSRVGAVHTAACGRLRSIAATFNGGPHLGQMCNAIFFAIARDAEIEVWITYFGGATDRATMEGFSRAARVDFKTSASRRDV